VALVGNDLYVANTDAIARYPYANGDTKITAPSTTLTSLPGGPIDHHWTKSLVASQDGSLLYVGIGSNSNITENGMEAEKDRASIWEVDRAFKAPKRARNFDWDPIRGLHHGQQAIRLHSKAVDMTANDRSEPISPWRDRGRPDMIFAMR